MAISFSGLASGLDTSSWVKSLTALKQAKVTTLQEQKQQATTSLDTLTRIKSFFTSFRSLLEKVTDTRFGIASMDLFSQNIANSANLNVLTASVTHEAEEGTYEVSVNKLASNTTASSKYVKPTVQVESSIADKNTLLKDLGVRQGTINIVNNDGSPVRISITNLDTIGSFIKKLNNSGISADYNEKTGIFSTDIDARNISDTGNTGIKDVLHLQSVPETWQSNKLQIATSHTVTEIASANTKLTELGIRTGTLDITPDTGRTVRFSVGSNTTIQDLVNNFNTYSSYGVNAEYKNGIFSLQGAEITNDNGTGLKEVFGLEGGVNCKDVITKTLSITETVTADRNTTLEQLGITMGQIIVNNPNGNPVDDRETFGAMNTIGHVFDYLTNTHGMECSIENGTITINGDYSISGSLADALGLSSEEFQAVIEAKSMTSTDSVTYTALQNATMQTTLGELGVTHYDFSYWVNGIFLESDTLNASTTLEQFATKLGDKGITVTLDDGILSFESNVPNTAVVITGGLATDLGVQNVYQTFTVQHSATSSGSLTYTLDRAVKEDDTLASIMRANGTNTTIKTTDTISIHSTTGANETLVVNTNSKLSSFANQLKPYGISMSISDTGTITFYSFNNAYINDACDIGKALGISAVTSKTVGMEATSTVAVTYTHAVNATTDTTLGALRYHIDGTITADGVTGNVIGISSVQEMEWLSNLVNSGNPMDGKTFVLTRDIDFGGGSFTPIGIVTTDFVAGIAFQGTFDGLGHTISNISTSNNAGLFRATSGAIIKNLNISNLGISGHGITGGLVKIAKDTIIDGVTMDNCTIDNTSIVLGSSESNITGSIVGEMYGGTLMNSQTIGGTITADGTAGGLVGAIYGLRKTSSSLLANTPTLISNCKNEAIISYSTPTSGFYAGGIAGAIDTTISAGEESIVIFENCLNTGAMKNVTRPFAYTSTTTAGGTCAGIAADIKVKEGLNVNFSNCVNSGSLSGSSQIKKGSIFTTADLQPYVKSQRTKVTLDNCLSVGQSAVTQNTNNALQVSVNQFGDCSFDDFESKMDEYGFDTSKWSTQADLAVSNEYQAIMSTATVTDTFTTLSFNGSTTISEMQHDINTLARGSEANIELDVSTGIQALGLKFKDGVLSFNNYAINDGSAGPLAAHIFSNYLLSSSSGISRLLNTESALRKKEVTTISETTTIGDLKGKNDPYYINQAILKDYESNRNHIIDTRPGIGDYFDPETYTAFRIMHDGKEYTITKYLSNDNTLKIEDLRDELALYGITVSVNRGKITFTGDENSYIIESAYTRRRTPNSANQDLFKIHDSAFKAVKTSSKTRDLTIHDDDVHIYSGDTLLSELGVSDATKNITLSNNATGATLTLSINPTETSLNELAARLGNFGISARYDESTGKFTIDGQGEYDWTNPNNYHIVGANSELSSALKINLSGIAQPVTTSYGKNSDSKLLQKPVLKTLTSDTTWYDLHKSGVDDLIAITVDNNGVKKTIRALKQGAKVQDFLNDLNAFGVQAYISKGKLHLNCNDGVSIESVSDGVKAYFNIETNAGETVDMTITKNSTPLTYETEHVPTYDSKLSELGVTNGYFGLVKDGVQYNVQVTNDTTLNDLFETFGALDIIADIGPNGQIEIVDFYGDFDIISTPGGSNIADVLLSDATINKTSEYKSTELGAPKEVQVRVDADKNTLLNALDVSWGDSMLKAEGKLSVTVDGVNHTLDIMSHETVGSFMEKLQNIGLEAVLADGKLNVYSKDKEFSFNTSESTSSLINNIGLVKTADSGISSSDELNVKHEYIANKEFSAANWADNDTKMSLLNISSGNLSIFRDGQKADITINENETFKQLKERINAAFSDVNLEFKDGKLTLSSSSGAQIVAGATSDTSNIASICGFSTDSNGNVQSARELYRVNGSSKITTSGLFRAGDVSEGTFTIGDAEFNIDSSTTINDLISQINSSEAANATAYWDSIKGELVIKSRTTGASLINIEAGSSNFTDILGYTSSDGGKKLNTQAQTLGSNAEFAINGTKFTATSNTITSDISKIKGVTLNLKGISEGGSTTLKIEKDTETAANAVEEIVESYNQLIENVDNELKTGGNLSNQTTLNLIRNQIRNLMTSSIATTGVFKNLNAVGIQLEAASANNISTANINKLTFNKDKFSEAFNADSNSLKALLVGDDTMKGVFTRVEEVVENAVGGVAGYFASTENSMNNKIQKLDAKIQKTQTYVDRYQARLEKNFSAMDLLISKIQQQYSSFLS